MNRRFVKAWVLAAWVTFTLCSKSYADHDFGAGFIIGDPTGITARLKLDSINSIEASLGWGGSDDFNLHVDYWWMTKNIFNIKKAHFDLFYGPGVRLRDRDKDCDNRGPGNSNRCQDDDDDDELHLGARAVGGILYDFKDPRIEVFGAIAMIMDLIPDTDADLELSIGGRFFF